MSNVIVSNLNGRDVLIEVDKQFGFENTTSAEEGFAKAKGAFDKARATIVDVAKDILQSIDDLEEIATPSEFQLQFAIKFNAEGQVLIAKVSTEGSLVITMTYRHGKS